MNSLFVTQSPRWNGETEFAAAVLAAEAALGWKLTVVAPPMCRLAAAAAARGARVLHLPGRNNLLSPPAFFVNRRWLARLTGENRFDLVHPVRAGSHALAAASLRNRPPIIHLRGGAKPPRGSLANRLLYRKYTAGVIVSSSRINDWLVERLRLPPKRVRRILPPVDTSRFRPGPADPELRREMGIPPGAPVILKVARLAPIKGHPVLIEAMARVNAAFPDAFLILVGGYSWDDRPEEITRRARDLGIGDRVIRTGRRLDVERFIRLADVCVSSSLGSEENSRAVSEYLAGGKPVVATRVGVIPELVADERSGLLVEPGRSEALSKALIRLLNNRELARRFGENGRAAAKKLLTFESFRERLEDFLGGLTAVSENKRAARKEPPA